MSTLIDGKYIDLNNVISRGNGVVFGKRSIGKSYGMNRRSLARRIRNHEAMVWVRFTEEEAETLFSSFGNGKWQKLAHDAGIDMSDLKAGKGRRILYNDNGTWRPLIRYWGLSEWQKARDNDDPEEKFIFFDEFIVPDRKLKCHDGNPAEHFLDMWVSLRRGEKHRCPFLLAGNPELGVDWFTPFLGINDHKKPESITTYKLPSNISETYSDDNFTFDRFTIQWTTNPGGAGSGGKSSGVPSALPESLTVRRSGTSNIYAQFDLGDGFFSVWYDHQMMVVDTAKTPGNVIKLLPDGNPNTVMWSDSVRKNLLFLREYWKMGRVRFTSHEAYRRFLAGKSKLL